MVEGVDFITNTREIERLDFEHDAYDQMVSVVIDFTDRDDYVPLKTGDDITNNRVLKEISEAIDYYHNKYPNRLIGELKIQLDNDGYVVDYYAPAKETVDFNSVEKEDHDPLDLENDKEKLADFIELTSDQFLDAYSYLPESVYTATCKKYGLRYDASPQERKDVLAKHGIVVDSPKYEIENVTDEAVMRHGRELANFPFFTRNKNGEAVGLSNDEAKFLEKKYKENVMAEAKDVASGSQTRGEHVSQEVR